MCVAVNMCINYSFLAFIFAVFITVGLSNLSICDLVILVLSSICGRRHAAFSRWHVTPTFIKVLLLSYDMLECPKYAEVYNI